MSLQGILYWEVYHVSSSCSSWSTTCLECLVVGEPRVEGIGDLVGGGAGAGVARPALAHEVGEAALRLVPSRHQPLEGRPQLVRHHPEDGHVRVLTWRDRRALGWDGSPCEGR